MTTGNPPLTSQQRLRLPHQEMPLSDPEKRITNFEEVPLGYTQKEAQLEAMRCLQCPVPKCRGACPVGVNIPAFIKLIEQGNVAEAAEVIRQTNFLPAACSRVCPQDKQCQAVCKVGQHHPPVGIGNLERFAADYERAHRHVSTSTLLPATGKKVAIVGSGPAGLTAAHELITMGHEVVVFEASHRAGGVMVYGIPRFRLPFQSG